MTITREEAADMAQAHAEGYHAELPREGCPECEDRPLRDYPTADDMREIREYNKRVRKAHGLES